MFFDFELSLFILLIELFLDIILYIEGEVVYMVSQRRNLNTANCSFINNKKFTILENTKKSLN